MKDIDFDELDKAVSSLMGGIKTQPDQPAAKTLKITSTLKEDETPTYENITQAAKKIGSETIGGPSENTAILAEADDAGTTVLELKDVTTDPLPVLMADSVTAPVPTPPKGVTPPVKSGRFMDVMHPSSDMKTTSTKATEVGFVAPRSSEPAEPSKKDTAVHNPSHQGVSITPPEPEHIAEDTAEEPAPAIEPLSITPETLTPDPSLAVNLEDTASEPEVTPTPEPQTSPFIPDAKVEKRPLGGTVESPGPVEDEFDIDTLDNKKQKNDTDTQLAPSVTESAELPEELHADLTAIEANLADEMDQIQAAESTVVEVRTEHTSTATVPAVAAQGTSVTDTPLSLEQTGAIFDTSEYHKPVTHAAKQKSGWLWIVLILVIVIICAAGAAAFYLLSA